MNEETKQPIQVLKDFYIGKYIEMYGEYRAIQLVGVSYIGEVCFLVLYCQGNEQGLIAQHYNLHQGIEVFTTKPNK